MGNTTASQRFGWPLLSGAESIGFYLSALIAARIISIGCRFLLAPSTAAAAYGGPAGVEPHSRANPSAKGIRDICIGTPLTYLWQTRCLAPHWRDNYS